jgi:hypothetical protein
MTVASPLSQIETVLAEKLLEADCERVTIEALRYSAEADRWQERFAALAVFALVGAVIGFVIVTHILR